MLLRFAALVVDVVTAVLARSDFLPAGRKALALERVIPVRRVRVVVNKVLLTVVSQRDVPTSWEPVFQEMTAGRKYLKFWLVSNFSLQIELKKKFDGYN